MLMELYNLIYKNEKIIGMNIMKLSEDKASRRANIIAVKTTWKHYNLLKGLKWNTHLLNKTFKDMDQLDTFQEDYIT